MGGRRIVDVHFAKVITTLSLGNKVQELSRRHLCHRIFVTCTCTKFNVPSSSSDEHKDFANAGGLLSPKVYGQFLLSFLKLLFLLVWLYTWHPRGCVGLWFYYQLYVYSTTPIRSSVWSNHSVHFSRGSFCQRLRSVPWHSTGLQADDLGGSQTFNF